MFSVLSFLRDLVMGNQVVQFQKAVREGDTSKAYTLYYTKDTVRTKLEPNVSLGPEFDGYTCLHYVAYHAMQRLYEDMIVEHRGKPDLKNDKRQNCLHLLCVTGEEGSVKRDMLQFTLSKGLPGMDLEHLLKEKDMEGNTVLHLAAGAGLEECVDLLVSYHADMVALNEEGLAPADLAKKNQHDRIALRLETHMVFSQEDDEAVVAMVSEPDPELLQEIAEGPVAMADQDLRSMKDKLLIETAEMLGVNMLTAEALLRQYGWSKEDLLGAWLSNPQGVCEEAGVDMPEQDATGNNDFLTTHDQVILGVAGAATPTTAEGEGQECGICCGSCDSQVTVPCGHHFCRDCWKQYLEARIVGGDSESICCPEYACYKRVPLEVIEGLVSREVAFKFLSFDLKAFVDSNPNIRWCPHPGCSQAVHKPAPPSSDDLTPLSPSHHHHPEEVKGQTVHCGQEHYFCWDCLGESHEPCTCERWGVWLEHVDMMKVKVGETTIAEADDAASSRWLVDFSKPCPKCKSPIEKTEGCNHMTCKKCRHDFCWVCLEDWKCHNSSTGGYFSCNRYDAVKKAEEMLQQRKVEAVRDADRYDEIGRFLHYYERYKEHIKSLSLEEPLLDQAQAKMQDLQTSILELEATTGTRPGATKSTVGATGATKSMGGASTGLTITFDSRTLSELSADGGSPVEGNSATAAGARPPVDLSFIHDAVLELLKCRRVLKASYCYGYYLQGLLSTRQFEHMQGGLEQVTEMLAEAVARPHLRKPRFEIIRLTREAREKRAALVKQVRDGFPSSSGSFLDSPFVNSMDTSRLQRLCMDLDNYRPPSSRNRERRVSLTGEGRDNLFTDWRGIPTTEVHGNLATEGRGNHIRPRLGRRVNEERMEDVLAESRREFEADRQMAADMELAKTLSLQNQPQPSPPLSRNSEPAYSSTLPLTDSWLDQLLARPSLSSQTARTQQNNDSSLWHRPTPSFDPFQCRSDSSSEDEETHSPHHQTQVPSNLVPSNLVHSNLVPSNIEPNNLEPSNLVPSNNLESNNSLEIWRPVFGEDEDLNLAIQESLILAPPPQPLNQVTQIPPSSAPNVPQISLSQGFHQNITPPRRHSSYSGNLLSSDLARDPLHSFSASQSTDWHSRGNNALETHPPNHRHRTEDGDLSGSQQPKNHRSRLGSHV